MRRVLVAPIEAGVGKTAGLWKEELGAPSEGRSGGGMGTGLQALTQGRILQWGWVTGVRAVGEAGE